MGGGRAHALCTGSSPRQQLLTPMDIEQPGRRREEPRRAEGAEGAGGAVGAVGAEGAEGAVGGDDFPLDARGKRKGLEGGGGEKEKEGGQREVKGRKGVGVGGNRWG